MVLWLLTSEITDFDLVGPVKVAFGICCCSYSRCLLLKLAAAARIPYQIYIIIIFHPIQQEDMHKDNHYYVYKIFIILLLLLGDV